MIEAPDLYAVIPSCCRPVELRNLVLQLVMDNVKVFVIDTGYERISIRHSDVRVIPDIDLRTKNIQRWWNIGLRAIYNGRYTDDEFYVAVLNDDLIVPPGFVQTIVSAMEITGGVAGCPVPGLRTPHMKIEGLETHLRMLGYAFVLRGSAGLYADESFGWWYGDNDLDWQARQAGGLTLVGGSWQGFTHLYPDSTTVGELAEQTNRDRQTFVTKWGRAPW